MDVSLSELREFVMVLNNSRAGNVSNGILEEDIATGTEVCCTTGDSAAGHYEVNGSCLSAGNLDVAAIV